MTNFDIPTLVNWIVSGLIAFAFGALSSWLTYRNERRRDDVAWEREKEKMQRQIQNDLEKLREEIKQELYKQRELMVRSEILPAIWKNLLDTIGRVSIFTAPLKRYPDLNHWTDDMISDFLKNSVLSDFHKKQLLETTDKLGFYQRTIYWYEIDDARKHFSEFHNHLLYNKIYLNDELFNKLSKIDKNFSDLFIAVEVHHEYPVGGGRELHQAYRDFHQSADSLVKEIEKLIQQDLN
jgi:hypothetical protein